MTAFSPASRFTQTCGLCGSVFQVEIERPASWKDTHSYSCPECGRTSFAKTSTPPRITLLSKRTDETPCPVSHH
ncbi:MAG: hypothetical protein U1E83_10260 [Methylotetracoccus sp.]